MSSSVVLNVIRSAVKCAGYLIYFLFRVCIHLISALMVMILILILCLVRVRARVRFRVHTRVLVVVLILALIHSGAVMSSSNITIHST